MSRDDEATVLDLVRAARLVVEFRGDLDKPTFLTDLKTQSAILHQILIFGEEVWKTATMEIPRLLPALESFAPRDPASPT